MSRVAVLLVAVAAIPAMPLFAYECPVSDEAIREAYFLGVAHDGRASKFLNQYTHMMPMPKSGPHVASITLETPYAQIVEYSTQALNFTAVDAVDRFSNTSAQMRVRIEIDLTATYTGIISSDASGTRLRADDFWTDFTVKLLQGHREIPAEYVSGTPIYVGGDAVADTLAGAIVTLNYPASDLSADSAKVEVVAPDGQDVRSQFDLTELR